jgi:hypothetical protein
MLSDAPAFSGFSVDDVATDEDGVVRGGGPLIAWFTDPPATC